MKIRAGRYSYRLPKDAPEIGMMHRVCLVDRQQRRYMLSLDTVHRVVGEAVNGPHGTPIAYAVDEVKRRLYVSPTPLHAATLEVMYFPRVVVV